jgi:hypothetical protein
LRAKGDYMSKLFQIEEEDLCKLEHILPELAQALMPSLNNKLRVQLRQCQSILSNVRWSYGPAGQVEILPANNDEDHRS